MKTINVTIDRLLEIEEEREQIMNSHEYQNWVHEFRVSRCCYDREPIYRAKELMKDYADYSMNFFTR